MTVFKPGDRVRCINDKDSGGNVTAGQLYTVDHVPANSALVNLKEIDFAAYLDRFVLVEEPAVTFKPGDRVRIRDTPSVNGLWVGRVGTFTHTVDNNGLIASVRFESGNGHAYNIRDLELVDPEPAVSVGTYDQRKDAYDMWLRQDYPRKHSPSEVLGFLLGDKTL